VLESCMLGQENHDYHPVVELAQWARLAKKTSLEHFKIPQL